MKKLSTLLLSVIMMVTVFAGCGGNTENPGSTGNPGSTSGSEVDKNAETSLSWEELKAQIPEDASGKTIEVYSWNNLNAVAQAENVVAKFTEETGIKVKWTVGDDCDNIALASRVAAGDSPDITRVRSCMPSSLKVLQPLSDVNFNFTDSAWSKEIMDIYTYNGKTYATTLKNTPYTQYSIVSYNTNLIENYGLEDPYVLWKKGNWTWDKMHEMAAQFLDLAGTDYKGISISNMVYAISMGLPTTTFDGEKYVTNIGDNKYVEACKYHSKYYLQGLYSNQPLDVESFNAGKLLFLLNSTISVRTGHFYYKELKEKGYVKVVPLPSVDGQEEYYQSLGEVEAYGICKGAKNADIAPYFLRYYLDMDNYFMDSFYCDESINEISDWCASQKNIITDVSASFMTKDTVGFTHGPYTTDLLKTPPAQIKSRLDSILPTMEAAAQEYTNELYNLNK